MKQSRLFVCFALFAVFAGCVHSPDTEGPVAASSSELVRPYYETEFGDGTERLPRAVASASHESGYRITSEMCGRDTLRFPRLQIDMRKGYCAGLVAGRSSGLIAPRTIVQIPKSQHFVVVDFGGWARNNGRVFLLERTGATYKLKVLLSKLDWPHGSAAGPDGKIYVATQEQIFRFNPLAPNPVVTVETVVRGLPGLNFAMPDGRQVQKNTHPLKSFVFDKTGAIYVNIGGPSDACLSQLAGDGSCFPGESGRAAGAIWKISPQAGNVFKALGPSDPNPPTKVFARGLRNSIALVAHSSYPAPGAALLQGENARDFKDPSQPNEELNAIIEGKHYGWPYCFNNESVSPEYSGYLASNEMYRGLCISKAKISYEKPYSLLPPHSAPLDLKYYTSKRLPELQGTVLVTWHGYQVSGSRIAFAKVDANGYPIKNTQALAYNQNCSSRRMIETAESKTIEGVQFDELVTGWYGVGGVRPQGAPVGMTIADDGSIWVLEDKNASIIRIDATNEATPPEPVACDSRSEEEIKELVGMIDKDSAKRGLLTDIRRGLVEKHCLGCHSDFGLMPTQSESDRDFAVAKYMLKQDSWFFPGNTTESRIYERTHAIGYNRPMPGNASELLATSEDYRKVVAQLGALIRTIVPGQLSAVSLATAPSLKIRNEAKTVCGSIPDGDPVIVVDKNPAEMPGFVRIFQPPKKFFNGDCPAGGKYYVGAAYVKAQAVSARTPSSVVEDLFVSRPYTGRKQFTPGIEGPAVDGEGRLYVVNYLKQGTIGVVDPNGKASEFLKLPRGSIANSIQISRAGEMFVADYKGHQIFKIDLRSKKLSAYVANVGMSQPNDLVLASTGVLYASDPDWEKGTGRIWRIAPGGEAKVILQGEVGTVNGLDLSPDEKTLYVGDSKSKKIWAFEIKGEGLAARRLVTEFS
ncbi:MAG: SMP-30/gluconolactonase/LRE family protein, partial [Bdellovibrionota bacterium]